MTCKSLADFCANIVAALAIVFCQNASGQITFQKSFAGETESKARVTSEGGSIIFSAHNYGGYYLDIYLNRINANGDTLWTMRYVSPDYERFADGCPTSDNGFIITGYKSTPGSNHYSMFLIKTDSTGNLIWSKIYADSIRSFLPQSVIETSAGNFVVTGGFGDTTTVNENIFVLCTDSSGSVNWTKSYNRYDQDFGYFIRQTTDQGFIISATSWSGYFSLDLLKLHLNGSVDWIKDYKLGPVWSSFKYVQVQQTFDGGYILTGPTIDSTLEIDILMIKTDNTGDTSWVKIYGTSDDDYPNWVEQSADSGYVICGGSYQSNTSKFLAMKTDHWGDTLWTRNYRVDIEEVGYTVQETDDHGYLFSGYHYDTYGTSFLVKSDSLGNSGCQESFPTLTVKSRNVQVSSPLITTSLINPIVSPFVLSTSSGGTSYTYCIGCSIRVLLSIQGNSVLCEGDTVSLESNISGISYLWSNGDTTSDLLITGSGIYSVVVTDTNGCSGSSNTVLITFNPLPSTTFTGLPDSVCVDEPAIELEGIPIGGTFSGAGMSDTTFVPSQATAGWNLISYQYSDSNGCSNSFFDSVFVEICLSADKFSSGINFNFSPNPATTFFTINSSQFPIKSISIFNLVGEKVNSSQYTINKNKIHFDVSNLLPGIYFVKTETENGTAVQKLIKQ
jgi:hypothetical protein